MPKSQVYSSVSYLNSTIIITIQIKKQLSQHPRSLLYTVSWSWVLSSAPKVTIIFIINLFCPVLNFLKRNHIICIILFLPCLLSVAHEFYCCCCLKQCLLIFTVFHILLYEWSYFCSNVDKYLCYQFWYIRNSVFTGILAHIIGDLCTYFSWYIPKCGISR